MALSSNPVKPSLFGVQTFDPNVSSESVYQGGATVNCSCVFKFDYQGNQPYYNELQICNVKTPDSPTYQVKVSTSIFTHGLAVSLASKLPTNNLYYARLRIYEKDGTTYSPWSDSITFACVKTPTFSFGNITESNVDSPTAIEASTYAFVINYSQTESEQLNDYEFYLYDVNKKQISQSGLLYPESYTISSSGISYSLEYAQSGLDDGTRYYVRCVGTTVNGLAIDTGYKIIWVKYNTYKSYHSFFANNDEDTASITYYTNVSSIDRTYQSIDLEYDDSKVMLMDGYIKYEDGFSISGDFTVKIKGIYFSTGKDFLVMKNMSTNERIFVGIYDYDEDGEYRVRLYVGDDSGNEYHIRSDPFDFDYSKFYMFVITRKDGLFDIGIITDVEGLTQGDMYIGSSITVDSSMASGTVFILDETVSPTEHVSASDYAIYVGDQPSSTSNFDVWIEDGGTL